MNIIFFDTETTGLPKNWKAPMTDLDNWPRVIQLAWMMCDESGGIILEAKHLIQPDGWEVPVEKFWIDNGYSTENCAKEGLPLSIVLTSFLSDFMHPETEVLVAHNMDYDRSVLGAEMIRYGFKPKKQLTRICTKEAGTDLCQIPGPYGFKWPSLTELHQHLFGTGFEGAHDALSDVRACKDCFFEMLKRDVIELPKPAVI